METNAPVLVQQEPSPMKVSVQAVLIIVQHVAPQLNVKSVIMVSNYKKVNAFQSVLMEHLLKMEIVLTVQKPARLAQMKILAPAVKKDLFFQALLALMNVQLEHIIMTIVTAVAHALMVAHNVKALKNVQDAKKALFYPWIVAHKPVQMDTIVLIILARNVKMAVLVVQVLINAMIVKKVLICSKANVSKNVQFYSIPRVIDVSTVPIHVLSVSLQMDAPNA